MKIASVIQRFLNDEAGPTAVEYAVMLALILVAVFAAINSVGSTTSALMQNNADQITKAVNTAAS
ncbi:pilus assembly protein Flp/PilA [Singulisphaera sp. GP187]|uniref:Flp family type IVb pilin n=1 Tax=Singulisphaera sp. GP187 TaxID=1882752 RepID=UPI00092AAA48|nr:Flp family type IVb pilin [Singulisphaera sp. GP187]SIO67534.1 pilus assembly protein Flp/PilA [Singulisphaera sp. GP187]